jgi:hypothetical protein
MQIFPGYIFTTISERWVDLKGLNDDLSNNFSSSDLGPYDFEESPSIANLI